MSKPIRYADIAVNLTDPQWSGEYHGKRRHPSDIEAVVKRAKEGGVDRILITGTSLAESRQALDLAKRYDLHCTVGCHPTQTKEMDEHPSGPHGFVDDLAKLVQDDRGEGGSKRIISIGEIGLDYDRLHFSPRDTQLRHLPALLSLGKRFRLPLFLHSRTSEAHQDLIRTLKEVGWSDNPDGSGWAGGVVHSFTGTKEEVDELVTLGLYIGINGCSLKTAENVDAVKHVPLDRLLLETDSPWCSITSTHASAAYLPASNSSLILPKVSKPDKWKDGQGVKGRMEPVEVRTIAHVVAQVRGVSLEELAEAVWENTMRLFYPDGDDRG